MKVQILPLDPHDDLASARDKLAWAQAQRVVFVWPDRARVLRRTLDLVLLRRQATRQGMQMGIVTRDPVVLDHARALRIPCFRSSTRLPEEVWQTGQGFAPDLPDRPEPRAPSLPPERDLLRPIPTWQRTVILSLVGLTLLVSACLLLPSATITVYPVTFAQVQDVAFRIDPQAQAPDTEGHVPARQVVSRQTGALRVTTTGQGLVPGAPASGEVTFVNLTDALVLIPAGTGVLPAGRPDLRFTTTEDVSLPAGLGASAGGRVVALQPGPAGNLPAGSLNAIDGPLGLRASVTQPLPLGGGTQTTRASVAPADHATALRTLTEQLLSQAATEIEAQLAEGESLAPASLRIANTLAQEFDRQIGEPADSVGLKMTLEITGLVFRLEDATAAAAQVLARELPTGAQPVPGSLSTVVLAPRASSLDVLQVRIRQEGYQPLPTALVRKVVRGLRPAEAVAHLAAIPGQAQAAIVTTTPAWWPWVPWLDIRIHVRAAWEQP